MIDDVTTWLDDAFRRQRRSAAMRKAWQRRRNRVALHHAVGYISDKTRIPMPVILVLIDAYRQLRRRK